VGPSQAENALISGRATAISLLALWVRLLSLFGCLHDDGRLAQFEIFLCRSYCLDVVAGLNDASASARRINKAPLLCPCTMLHNVVCAACRLLAGATIWLFRLPGACSGAVATVAVARARSSPSLPLGESAHALDAF